MCVLYIYLEGEKESKRDNILERGKEREIIYLREWEKRERGRKNHYGGVERGVGLGGGGEQERIKGDRKSSSSEERMDQRDRANKRVLHSYGISLYHPSQSCFLAIKLRYATSVGSVEATHSMHDPNGAIYYYLFMVHWSQFSEHFK